MADEKSEQKQAPKPEAKPEGKASPKLASGTKSSALKGKKRKRWYPIIAPQMFNNMILGETLLDESAQLTGKVLSMSMMNISGDPKKQNINIQFRVSKVQDGKGLADIFAFELQPNSLRRLMRRGRKKVDDSFVIKTLDGKFALCKPIIVTQGPASHQVLTDLRKNERQLLKEIIHNNTFDIVIQDLLEYKPQGYLRDMLSKIYPIRNVEIRVFSLTKQTRETVDVILAKMAPEAPEDADEGDQEEGPEQEAEQAEAPIDQMQEIEEEKARKKTSKSDEENPLSEGV